MTPILSYMAPGLPSVGGSGLPVPGYFVYWPSINCLLQGTPGAIELPPVGLDAQRIGLLPDNIIIVVSIGDRGESNWLRVGDASSPSSDVNAGVIVPLD